MGNTLIELKGSWLYISFCNILHPASLISIVKGLCRKVQPLTDGTVRSHSSWTTSIRAYRNKNSGTDTKLMSSLFKILCTRRHFLFQVHKVPLTHQKCQEGKDTMPTLFEILKIQLRILESNNN